MKKELTIAERLALMPISEKARLMFLIKKREKEIEKESQNIKEKEK